VTVNCRISIDNRPDATDAIFQAVPRIGESVSLSVDGIPQDLRVSRVVHVPDVEKRIERKTVRPAGGAS